MKLRTAYIPLFFAASLPCTCALFFLGVLTDNVFGGSIAVTSLVLVIFALSPSYLKRKYPSLHVLHGGCVMLKTLDSSVIFHIVGLIVLKTFAQMNFKSYLSYLIAAAAVDWIISLGGSVRVFIKCTQLSLLLRVFLAVTWGIPLVGLIAINKARKVAWLEFERESSREDLNNLRAENEICKTKYPIVLVHGIFFRDVNFFNYWGRIPKELVRNGAVLYYGSQRSAASVSQCGTELKQKIDEIINITGCGKVNIIAHSKGGLDARFAASLPGMNEKIASITTINTPHAGCKYADYLIEKLPRAVLDYIAMRYNTALYHFGEENSDFAAGVADLTEKHCGELAELLPLPEGVFCQSYGSYMKNAASAGFPLNAAYLLVSVFSTSPNDGLVDAESMRWGESFTLFEPTGRRGISHGDMNDIFREDINGFDVREEYVKIAAGLKNCGF
ncbi:MAG: triacylglycerol lipase [Clostridia bacterium]|nr:triacylglycerol lipase [Clostridia bacterium]